MLLFRSFNDKFLTYLLIYYYIFKGQACMKFMVLANVGAFPLLPKNQSLPRGQARGGHTDNSATQGCCTFRNVPSQINRDHNLHLGQSKHP